MTQLARGLGIAVASAGIGSRGWRRAAVACPVAVRLRRRDPRDGDPHVMIAGEIERRRRVETRVGRFPGGAKNPRRLGKSVPLNAPRGSAAERARAARTASAGETGGSPIQREGARPA